VEIVGRFAECRNGPKPMDFEVRHVVKRVLRPCLTRDDWGVEGGVAFFHRRGGRT
jgi:hypothetical protein